MEVIYDARKNAKNIALRGLSFERVKEMDLLQSVRMVDDRRDYGETRYRVAARLDGRLHVVVFTETKIGIRVISFRRANKREVKRYG